MEGIIKSQLFRMREKLNVQLLIQQFNYSSLAATFTDATGLTFLSTERDKKPQQNNHKSRWIPKSALQDAPSPHPPTPTPRYIKSFLEKINFQVSSTKQASILS